MKTTKVAIFDLTGCEGCEFHLLSLNELLLDFFQNFTITHWRLLSEESEGDFDIAFIEGAVTTQEQIKLLKEIRKTSKIVVAIGACAISGNVFAQLSPEQRKKLAPKIYDKKYKLKAKFLKPVEEFIKVDEKIPGCPPNLESFKKLLEKLGKKKVASKSGLVKQPDYTAKIEGHGILKINFSEEKVTFEIEESERLIEGLVLEKDYSQAPFINSRICGICPIAHNLCSWSAIENAFQIEISQETIDLRKILASSQIIKSHLLHLFFLALPDYAGVKNATELSKKYPAEFHLMLNIKRVADKALEIIAGSTAFPINTSLGGFKKIPSYFQLLELRDQIFEIIDEVEDLIKLFADIKMPQLKVETKLIHSTPLNNSYPLYPGKFNQAIKEVVRDKSTAKLGFLNDGQIVKVGALSRINHSQEKLNPKAQKILKEARVDFKNPFHNNLAQAIEILHYSEEILALIDKLNGQDLEKTKEVRPNLPKQMISGEACLEAPRGLLIHRVKIDPDGKINDYNIIPPTQINLPSLEKEAQLLIKAASKSPHKMQINLTERLIRAFDPCITCAVH